MAENGVSARVFNEAGSALLGLDTVSEYGQRSLEG
jgi:hypothetical protein